MALAQLQRQPTDPNMIPQEGPFGPPGIQTETLPPNNGGMGQMPIPNPQPNVHVINNSDPSMGRGIMPPPPVGGMGQKPLEVPAQKPVDQIQIPPINSFGPLPSNTSGPTPLQGLHAAAPHPVDSQPNYGGSQPNPEGGPSYGGDAQAPQKRNPAMTGLRQQSY